MRGVSYFQLKKYEAAVADFTKAIELNPVVIEAYQWRGMAYESQKKNDLAIADYSKLIALSPKDNLAQRTKDNELHISTAAYLRRGRIYHDQKKYDFAVHDYTKVIELNPFINDEGGMAYWLRAAAYTDQKKYLEAARDYYSLELLYPGNAEIYSARANVFCLAGEKARAAKDEQVVLRLGGKIANPCK